MTDTQKHKRNKKWYTESFGRFYPLIYRHRGESSAAADIESLVHLAKLQSGQSVLDICCGAGRHMVALQKMNMDVWGVDLSEVLLCKAAERESLRGRLVRSDVRYLPFDGCFDAAVNMFTSFGYFADERDNIRQLRCMVRVVKRGGIFAMDLANAAVVKNEFKPFNREQVDGMTLEHNRRWIGQRIEKQTTITEPNGRVHRFFESVRMYEPSEFLPMCDDAGLTNVQMYGSFDGEPMTDDSPRMIVTGKRA